MDGADVDGTADAVTEPALLQAEALECGYAGVPVTGRLDLVVRPGERVGIIGAGNLGLALADYAGFKNEGFEIVALFDSSVEKVGQQSKGGVPIHGMRDLRRQVRRIEDVRAAPVQHRAPAWRGRLNAEAEKAERRFADDGAGHAERALHHHRRQRQAGEPEQHPRAHRRLQLHVLAHPLQPGGTAEREGAVGGKAWRLPAPAQGR